MHNAHVPTLVSFQILTVFLLAILAVESDAKPNIGSDQITHYRYMTPDCVGCLGSSAGKCCEWGCLCACPYECT